MVATGLTTEMITPHLQQSLRLVSSKSDSTSFQGFGAGGSTYNQLIKLNDASLCCDGTIPSCQELALPSLNAVITDFPQEHIDPKHDPIEGMIGMELLEQYDVDFDFPAGRLRFWKAGTCTIDSMNDQSLVEIPAVTINETGLIGIRITTPAASTNHLQPIIGFLDCGSTFSVVNWSGAQYLYLPKQNDPIYKKSPHVIAFGVDGTPIQLSTLQTPLTYAGDIRTDSKTRQVI
jgi:hypothetical protein